MNAEPNVFEEDSSEIMEISNRPSNQKESTVIVEKWCQLFSEGQLTVSHFKTYWRTWVPRAFVAPNKNEKGSDWEVKEDIVQNVLIDSLEEFICSGNTSDFFSYLYDRPRPVCGKVFKMGEASYNCRECAIDLTCVLCVDCFKQSPHRHHKYKMGSSLGGGCCDCGDTEAWKSEPCCDTHQAGANIKSEDLLTFPQDLTKRGECVFSAVLQYCSEIMTLEYPDLLKILRLREDENPNVDMEQYCILIYDSKTSFTNCDISTLVTVLDCSNRDALDYVTCTSREGRSIIKCSTLLHCNELKKYIERLSYGQGSQPIEVKVVHSHVIAHQMFALQLLNWILKLTNLSNGFRKIFAYSVMCINTADELPSLDQEKDESHEHQTRLSFLEGILLQDRSLWKTARLFWHRLFIAAMFAEYENKKAFAKVFTHHYCVMLKNFIREDHDYLFSFASLSIQLFTVPKLSHHLIATEDVLFKLLNTFVAECSEKRNGEGKLDFNRAASLGTFRRAMYILHDLRYLLHSPPEPWSAELRKGFLKGVTMILNLFTYMEGMNAIKRQIGTVLQHMEYEPERDIAFTLQNQLSPIITLILKWCSSDQIVLMEVYRLTLEKLLNFWDEYNHIEEEREVANHKATCCNYDVSEQPVSIHLPLSRFLAGLFLLLENFGLNFFSDEFVSFKKPSPKQIIEPVLRTQVMMAQVQAGMWRKNGYIVTNQISYYNNIKRRREMQDKDIVLLQIGASLMDSNEFLIHLLNKFNLIDWINPEFETTFYNSNLLVYLKTSPKIVEEFLTLLVKIISERFVPGVGNVTAKECLKNEIVHQLFVMSFSHSELNKRLPDELNYNETGMESVIDDVATFRKPTQSSGKGVYEVKKEFVNKYNVFHHHYSKEDMSKSEEELRKQMKTTFGLECCPPPTLPHFTKAFEAVLNLLQCDVMFNIMKTVLERALDIKVMSSSEGQLHAVLYLIGHALQEQERNSIITEFIVKAEKWGIKSLMDELLDSHRVDAHRDLIRWTVNKYRNVVSPLEPIEGNNVTAVHLQKESDDELQGKNTRAQLVAKKRAAILAQMAALQQNFLKANPTLFQEEKSSLQDGKQFTITCDSEPSSKDIDFPVALGANQSPFIQVERTITCILCQEEQVIKAEGPPIIIAAFLQKSSVLMRERSNLKICNNQILSCNIGPAVHLSTCGHAMHITCWNKYINTILAKQIMRPCRLVKEPLVYDAEKNEFLCPLCQRLSNTALPVMPHLSAICSPKPKNSEQMPFSDWYEITLIIIEPKNKRYRWNSPDLQSPSNYTSLRENISPLNICVEPVTGSKATTKNDIDKKMLSRETIEVVNQFIEATIKHDFGGKGMSSEDNASCIWRTCAYTIHSLEWLLRRTNKSLLGDFTSREQECLENIIRLSGVLAVSDEKETGRNVCLHMLNTLFTCKRENSVLEWDSLGVLIPLTISMPHTYYKDVSPVPIGQSVERHCFRTALFVHFAQTIICTDLSEQVFLLNGDVTSEDTKCLDEIVRILKDCQSINTIEIWELLKKYSMSFLRSAAIFYHFLTGVPAPKALKVIGGDTYENIMNFLGMPTSCKKLLGDPCVLSIFRGWAKHPNCVKLRHQLTVRSMIVMNELIRLPEDYSEIMNSSTTFKCPNTNEEIANPSMCLICGQMLCSASICCQNELNNTLVGACTYHADSCGAGIGVFLRVHDCQILLLDGQGRGCMMAAPYLDLYGEVDQGLKRGNPMHLWEERYRHLQILWLSHGIPDHIASCSVQNVNHQQWSRL